METIVDALPDRYKLMALLAAWCAMRFGELAELRRGDNDLRKNRVSITRGVVRLGGKFVVGSPKSDAGVRDVAIPPRLLPVVKAHLKNHAGKGKDALLFPAAADSNAHMAPSTLSKVYYPARKAAGREDLRWHDPPHGRLRGPDRRDPRRTHGPPGSLDPRCGDAIPAHRRRPRSLDGCPRSSRCRTRLGRWIHERVDDRVLRGRRRPSPG